MPSGTKRDPGGAPAIEYVSGCDVGEGDAAVEAVTGECLEGLGEAAGDPKDHGRDSRSGDQRLGGQLGLVVDVAWSWREALVDPDSAAIRDESVAVHRCAAGVDDPAYAPSRSLGQQRLGRIDVDRPELRIRHPPHVGGVQCRNVDHHVGSVERPAAGAGITQVADQLRARPTRHVDAANNPARRLGHRGDGAADHAGTASDQYHRATGTPAISLGESASHGCSF